MKGQPPIQTVLGPVEADELGTILPHEHLVIDFLPFWLPPEDDADLQIALGAFDASQRARVNHEPELVLDAIGNPTAHSLVEELAEYASLGGDTLIEVTPIGMGRQPRVLAGMSRLSGLHVVMSTAFYVEPFHPPFLNLASEETIAELFIEELNVGVGGTGIRAGLIGEIGTGSPATSQELKVVRAAAMASHATGVSVNLHRTSYPDPLAGLKAIDLLLEMDVRPDRIVASHCDERPEPEYAFEAAQRGVYVEFDTWGMDMWATRWVFDGKEIPAATDGDRLRNLGALLDAGYIDQLLLSQDVCNKAQLLAHGGYGYGHLLRSVRQRLTSLGVTPEEEQALLQANPQRMIMPRTV